MRVPVFDERAGAFARLRGRRVLIYWPHGFGDFVHFSYVAPYLSPENTYRIARFGDDFTHLYDGQEIVAPLYTGIVAPSSGPPHFEHLGIDFKCIRNREMEVAMPPPLSQRYFNANLDTILYTDYPEFEGRQAFPFHTKARSLLRQLVTPERLAETDLTKPLKTLLTCEAPAEAQHAVDTRLRERGIERFVVVASGGHTNVGKSWPRERVERLQDLLATRGVQTVIVDEAAFARLFEGMQLPFAHALLALLARSVAFVGVAAGPLHLALACGGRPIIGLWSRHYPDWYDEPCPDAVHFVSASAIRARLHQRPATLTKPANLRDRIVHVDEDIVDAERVDAALRDAGV